MINVDKVVDYIHAHWKRLPKKPCLDGDDSNFTDFLLEALNSAANGNFEIFKEMGSFQKKGYFKAPNVFVTCHTSHIMTKNLMKTFFEEIVFDPSIAKDALLLVNSWTSWKDQSAIDSVTPPTNHLEVRVIPPGCTGMVQPCDVGIFGSFKKVVKMIAARGQLTHPKYKIYARDETLKLLSLVWWQLCSPKLQPWAQYAWHMGTWHRWIKYNFFEKRLHQILCHNM